MYTCNADAGIYVSTTGVDANPGTITLPYKTLSKAASVISANDTIFVRGGTYVLTSSISLSKAGSNTARYYIFRYPGEHPLFDFTTQTSSDGIKVNGSYWYLYGIEIKGSAHNGIAVNGSHNTIENCSVHDNRNTGMQLGNGASYNKVINCDSYFNYDAPSGGNADGFAPKLDVGTGNYFYGCRSWQNSDDGWDGYMRPADNITTTIENCWAFMNGYLKDGKPIATGNGNGFKMGGGDTSNIDSLRHNMILKNCICFDNRVKGYDQNNNRGSMTLLNCTAYRNGSDNFRISSFIRVTESLTVKNCVSVGGTVSLASFAVQQTNSWLSPFVVASNDFVSLDTTGVRGPRKADGSLPDITFLHLAPTSDLIDAGVDAGLPFNGGKPDLGAFETETPDGVSETKNIAAQFSLSQNYPNPFNPSTIINYELTKTDNVSLKIYDMLGRDVATLVDEVKNSGMYTATFTAPSKTAPASGIYFYTLRAGNFVQTKKMTLLK